MRVQPGPTLEPMLELPVIDLGRMDYAAAYRLQVAHHEEVLAARDAGRPEPGRLLLVEHDPPVITVSRREGAAAHLLASPDILARLGVQVAETDRGGDITYHGPGQLVAYPILDLNFLRLRLHDYLRLLEQSVIDLVAEFQIPSHRDPAGTGVWVPGLAEPFRSSKICAIGIRIKRWVTLHGLAINVTTNLEHFNLIVPCGLAGRSVTSLQREAAARQLATPSMHEVKQRLHASLARNLSQRPRAGDPGPT